MIIAGGGPAGLLCAKEIATRGEKAVVYEEHSKIGEPVHCTGLVSRRGLDALDVDYKGAVLNECRGARFFSPRGQMLEVKRREGQACVLDRAKLDQTIAEEAKSAGAEIITGKRWEGKCDVAADGPLSAKAPKRECVHAYQVTADLKRDVDFTEIHYTPGFFAWVVPVSEKQCRVGIGVRSGNPKEALMRWLAARKMVLEFDEETSALIPIYDGKPAVRDNVCLVGDAAAQVKATSGGGIAIGGFCARICGAVLGEGQPIAEYEHLWRKEWGASLDMHLRLRQTLDRIPPGEIENLFTIAREEGLASIAERHGDMERIVPLINALVGKPKLALRLAKYMRYL